MTEPKSQKDEPQVSQPPEARPPSPPTWKELSDGFEALGRVGLAMAVGFSAAGAFCRLVDKKAIRLPSVSSLLLSASAERPPRAERDSFEGSPSKELQNKKGSTEGGFRRFEVGDLDEPKTFDS